MPNQPKSQSIAEPQQSGESAPKRKIDSIYPAWSVWKQRTSIKLWEIVALSKNIDPSKLEQIKEINPDRYRNYCSRLKTAISWLNTDLKIQEHPKNGMYSKNKMVKLVDFVRCAQTKSMKITPKLLAIYNESNEPLDKKTNDEPSQPKKSSESLALRNDNLQKAANKIAGELRKKADGKKIITKREVAKELSKNEFRDMTIPSIERSIRVQWYQSAASPKIAWDCLSIL